jgi:hypothetical protein
MLYSKITQSRHTVQVGVKICQCCGKKLKTTDYHCVTCRSVHLNTLLMHNTLIDIADQEEGVCSDSTLAQQVLDKIYSTYPYEKPG